MSGEKRKGLLCRDVDQIHAVSWIRAPLRGSRDGVGVGRRQPSDVDSDVGVWNRDDAGQVLEVAGTGAGAADVGDTLALLAGGGRRENVDRSGVGVAGGEAGGERADRLVANVADAQEVVAAVDVVVDAVAVEEGGSERGAGGNESRSGWSGAGG